MKRTALIWLASLLGFAGMEGLIFHTGLYASILKTDSSAGFLDTVLDNETRRPLDDRNQIVGIGDSRMALVARVANQVKSETGYTFASLGAAGTTPRCWYYMLRDVDPSRDRYAAIVVTLDSFDDAEVWEDYADRESDLHYLIARLRLSDLFEFSGSYHDPGRQREAFRGILLKGLVYKRDLEDFLLHPVARIKSAEQSRRDSHTWIYDFVDSADTLKGLTVDWNAKTLTLGPQTDPAQKPALVDRLLKPVAPQTGRQGAYLKYWLGKICDRYRGSRTRVVFLRVPRAPLIRPDQPPFNPNSSVRELATHPNVTLLPDHLFDFLERPEFFKDEAHLAQPGLDQFSTTLARRMREVLGPPQ